MPREKRGLGTGLEALFGSELQSLEEKEITNLPLSRVEPQKDQPRTHFDEESLQDLANSIARHGLIQPVVVRPLNSGDYQIIAGERRWRAARMAGLREIPVRVIRADDRMMAELTLVENIQRENLNPMEEARGFQQLMDRYELTQEEVSVIVEKSRPAVANSLRLLSLSPPVSALVEDGSLSAGHARALLGLTDEEGQLQAARDVIRRSLSVRKTEQLVAKTLKEREKAESEEKGSEDEIDYASVLSEELSQLLGRRVRLSEKEGKGRLELYFDSASDREALIEQLRNRVR